MWQTLSTTLDAVRCVVGLRATVHSGKVYDKSAKQWSWPWYRAKLQGQIHDGISSEAEAAAHAAEEAQPKRKKSSVRPEAVQFYFEYRDIMAGRGLIAQASFRQLQHIAPELYGDVNEHTHKRLRRSGALKPSGGSCEKITGGVILHLQELAKKITK